MTLNDLLSDLKSQRSLALFETDACNAVEALLTIKGRVGNAAIAGNVPGAANINQDVALLRFNDRLPIWFVIAYLNSFLASFGWSRCQLAA